MRGCVSSVESSPHSGEDRSVKHIGKERNMATPAIKSQILSDFLENFSNRREAIVGDRCINPPMGCGGPAIIFRDPRSMKEYTITGFCQTCQDKIFRSES